MYDSMEIDFDNIDKDISFRIAECLNLNDRDKIDSKYKIILETVYENQYSNIKCNKDEIDYKVDFKFKKKSIVKIYGFVKENNNVVENKIVILYKEIQRGYNTDVIEVAKTLTDFMGTFMFIQPYYEDNINYRVKIA